VSPSMMRPKWVRIWSFFFCSLAPAPRLADPMSFIITRQQLFAAFCHCGSGHTQSVGHQAVASIARTQRLHPGKQPTLPLVQDSKQALSGLLKRLIGGGRMGGGAAAGAAV